MKNKLYTRIVVIGVLSLLLGAGFITTGENNINEGQKTGSLSRNSITITAGQPTKNGTWTVYISHTGTTPSGTPYTGTWPFTINTHPGMTPAEKADEMKKEINKKGGCPLTASSSGSNVQVTSDNGKINSWSSKSTDGQWVHGTYPSLAAFSFMGTPTSGAVTVDAGGFLATTTTNGKTLMQIHNELAFIMTGLGVPTMIDPSELALYIMVALPDVGLDSDDDGLASYGVFYDDFSSEPFGVYVGMHDIVVGNPGSTVALEFEISNFIFTPNTYHVTATDLQGWNIVPDDFLCDLMPGESGVFMFDVDIPPRNFAPSNIMNVTATAVGMPWITSYGLAEIYENNPPEVPDIDGPIKGKPKVEYTYTFCASDPDGDEVYYWVQWGDGCPSVEWAGPYASGEEVTIKHTYAQKGTYTISCKAKDVYDAESDWGYLEVSIPKTRTLSIYRILDIFPNMFPILRHLLGL